jgi:hypothetical protein
VDGAHQRILREASVPGDGRDQLCNRFAPFQNGDRLACLSDFLKDRQAFGFEFRRIDRFHMTSLLDWSSKSQGESMEMLGETKKIN